MELLGLRIPVRIDSSPLVVTLTDMTSAWETVPDVA